MDVAEEHLAQLGYQAISLQQIAREVGVTKPSLYYHFPQGKEGLVVAILHRSLVRVGTGLTREMAAATDGAGKLRAAALWLCTKPDQGRRLGTLHDVLRFIDQRHHESLTEEFLAAAHEPVRSAIASAIASGEFRSGDAGLLAWSFLSLAQGLLDGGQLTSHADPTGELSLSELAERLVDLFLNGVRV